MKFIKEPKNRNRSDFGEKVKQNRIKNMIFNSPLW